ncbi:MAG: amino acid adenylation domain-containing protein [Deltaproteobacteria bacterium]|nr:amino acid adenylation domain-containing protein [Deltaproteobacteria bacterium]
MRNSAISFLYETVREFPGKPCISDDRETVTFSEVLSRAFKLAEALRKDGQTNRPVAVYLPKTTSAVVSFAGILMSGNFYVPVDRKSPRKRLQNILGNLLPWRVVTVRQYEPELQELSVPPEKTVFLEDLPAAGRGLSIEEMIRQARATTDMIIDTDPCYVMHTSGSTGIPKGVVVPHRGVVDYIEWAIPALRVDAGEVIGNQAPLCFDNSTLDIYLSWATGAELRLIPEDLFVFPARLIQYLEKHRISFVFFVPSVLVNIARFDLLSPERLPHLKKIVFAGEVMPTRHLAYWQENLPDRLYVNLYGPTEITVDCTYFIVDRRYEPHESLPIGFPCHNSGILILNDKDRPAGTGEQGELCVRGSSLALGYWRDEEKTREVFVQNPLHNDYRDPIYRTGDIVYRNERGEIMYVGRKDGQIKHMGKRIELGEIETAAMGVPHVDRCCAAYDREKQEIILFYEAGDEIPVGEFKRSLGEVLPKYMIPRKIRHLEKLPAGPNGKIDRRRLLDGLS